MTEIASSDIAQGQDKSNGVSSLLSSQPAPELPSQTPDTISIIDRAENAYKKLEEANKKMEEMLLRQEQVAARLLLGGRAEAGQVSKTPEQETEEKLKAEVAAVLKKYRA